MTPETFDQSGNPTPNSSNNSQYRSKAAWAGWLRREETQHLLRQLKEELDNVTRSAESLSLSPTSADSQLRVLLIRQATLRQTIERIEICQ
jgi:hypothetical protein